MAIIIFLGMWLLFEKSGKVFCSTVLDLMTGDLQIGR